MNHLSLGMNQVLWSTCLVYLECMITFLKFPYAMFKILSYLWFGYIRQWIIESQLFSKKYFLLSKKDLRFKFLFVNRFESCLLKLSNWNDSNVYTLLRWIQSIICLLKVTKSRKVFSNGSHIQNNQKLVESNCSFVHCFEDRTRIKKYFLRFSHVYLEKKLAILIDAPLETWDWAGSI